MTVMVQNDPSLVLEYSSKTPVISCVIPAYNEEDSIAQTIESLLSQTRPPDFIHILVNNSSDDTVWESKKFEGHHNIAQRGSEW